MISSKTPSWPLDLDSVIRYFRLRGKKSARSLCVLREGLRASGLPVNYVRRHVVGFDNAGEKIKFEVGAIEYEGMLCSLDLKTSWDEMVVAYLEKTGKVLKDYSFVGHPEKRKSSPLLRSSHWYSGTVASISRFAGKAMTENLLRTVPPAQGKRIKCRL